MFCRPPTLLPLLSRWLHHWMCCCRRHWFCFEQPNNGQTIQGEHGRIFQSQVLWTTQIFNSMVDQSDTFGLLNHSKNILWKSASSVWNEKTATPHKLLCHRMPIWLPDTSTKRHSDPKTSLISCNCWWNVLFCKNCTRPDIMFSISALAQSSHARTTRNLSLAKRILHYIKGKWHYGIKLNLKENIVPSIMRAAVDAIWGGRSTCGYIFDVGAFSHIFEVEIRNCCRLIIGGSWICFPVILCQRCFLVASPDFWTGS